MADDDETSCADKLELVYRTAYSHPAVEGIMMWVFWAGASWRGPNAGLAHRDWTLNEAGKRYEALMEEWTTEVSGQTDADGVLSFRGFTVITRPLQPGPTAQKLTRLFRSKGVRG